MIPNERVRESVIRLTHARERMRDIAPKKDNHICMASICMPLNEPALISLGFIAPPIICESVYLCRFGNVHICTPQSCTRFLENKTGVCPISNIQYQCAQQTDYDKEDWRTWYQTPQTKIVNRSDTFDVSRKKRTRLSLLTPGSLDPDKITLVDEDEIQKHEPKAEKRTRIIDIKSIENKVKETLRIILFSPLRKRFNDEVTKQHKIEHKKAQERYISNCKKQGQIPNLIDLLTISNYYSNLPLPLMNIEMDHTMHEHYTNIILQIWEKVQRYSDDNVVKVNVQAVVLGALYTMRQGLVADGLQLIPRDSFMCQRGVLPLINDIVKFGFTKRKVTSGEKLIDSAYNRALTLNVSREDLLFDYTRIKEKATDDSIFIAVGKGIFKKKKKKKKVK